MTEKIVASPDDGIYVSLVTPVEGRFALICQLVESVRRAWDHYTRSVGRPGEPAALIEHIFVDSTPEPIDVSAIPAWDSTFMRIVRGDANVRKKRNRGVEQSRGEWIAFVDSDCVLDTGYFSALFRAISGGEASAFAGRIEFRGEENWVWKMIAETQLTAVETQTHGKGEVAWCATANLVVRKSRFEMLGGFDETLPFRLGGDDVDFGLRLTRSGAALQILPSVIVIHPKSPWSRLDAILPRAWRWGKIEYHLAQRHKERVRVMPPYSAAMALSIVSASLLGCIITGNVALLLMIPFWLIASFLLSTFMTRQAGSQAFWLRCAGRCLHIYYYSGTVRAYLGARSLRFLWEALILEDRVGQLYPNEARESWAQIMAVLAIALAGFVIIVAR